MVTELTDKTFATEIKLGTPILIDFWAEWCGPCKMLAPVLEEVSTEFTGKLKFAKLDTEKYPRIAMEQGISGIPCLIIFKNGKEIDRIIGFSPKPILKQKIEKVLSNI